MISGFARNIAALVRPQQSAAQAECVVAQNGTGNDVARDTVMGKDRRTEARDRLTGRVVRAKLDGLQKSVGKKKKA